MACFRTPLRQVDVGRAARDPEQLLRLRQLSEIVLKWSQSFTDKEFTQIVPFAG
jgi:hypothetical protein